MAMSSMTPIYDDRIANDHYPTPPYYAEGLVAALGRRLAATGRSAPSVILDAGAGNDPVWLKAARKVWGVMPYTVGVEVRPVPAPAKEVADSWHNQDFLAYSPAGRFDLIMSNPPFALAEPFILHALKLLTPGGVLAMLLPVTFLGGIKRGRGLWRQHPPDFVWFLTDRPSFAYGDRFKSEYAFILWENALTPEPAPGILFGASFLTIEKPAAEREKDKAARKNRIKNPRKEDVSPRAETPEAMV